MYKEHWQHLLESLRVEIPAHDFETWFLPIRFLKAGEDAVRLSVPTEYNRIWLVDNYIEKINRDLNNLVGKRLSIELVVDEAVFDEPGDPPPRVSTDSPKREPRDAFHALNLIPSYTFDRFIVGENNQLANAAALKVAQNPGKAYSPLFIYGGVGLGKTHLMHAIGNKLLKKDVNYQIACLTSEEFTNLFVESIRKNQQSRFRNSFRNLDVLMLDDVQFLLNKEETKNELFNTFNALHDRKKQIILTSDRTPQQLKVDGMDDRLASRIGGGLDVEIRPPSYETKQAILKAKAEEEKISIPNEVMYFIADVVDADVRLLEQALTKIIAEHRLLETEISIEQAKKVLRDFVSAPLPRNISIEDIIRETSNVFKISKVDIKSKSRTSQINLARQIVMFLAREYTSLSLKEIGSEIGKEHPTIISGIRKIQGSLDKDVKVRNKIEEIVENLTHK